MPLDPTFFNSVLLIATAFGGAFLAALWLALVIWTWRDIRSRARDPLAHVLAVLVVAALNLPGILVYLILRPPRTLEEDYQRTLEEEALLASIEDQALCPGCERKNPRGLAGLPQLPHPPEETCPHCGKLMELPWNICPYCGTPAPGVKREQEA